MEETLYEPAVKRANALGLPTFSAYVVQLIRRDLADRGVLQIHEMADPTPPPAPVESPPEKVTYTPKRQTKKKP